MYSAEHRFTNLLNDRLFVPLAVCKVEVLYVDRQGASFPIGCLPQIARLSSGTKGGRRQADSSTSRPERIGVSGINATTAGKYIKFLILVQKHIFKLSFLRKILDFAVFCLYI